MAEQGYQWADQAQLRYPTYGQDLNFHGRCVRSNLIDAAGEQIQGRERCQPSFSLRGNRPADAQDFFRLGMTYSTGVSADMVSAHKRFNIAAMLGNAEAARLRQEIAGEMSDAEIAAAQRAARVDHQALSRKRSRF